MVHPVEEDASDDGVELSEIGAHSGERIEGAGHRHLDFVVVSVRAVALAVEAPVVRLGQRGARQSMPGAEMVPPGELEATHGPKYST